MKKKQLQKNAVWRALQGTLSKLFVAAVLVFLLAALVLLAWQKSQTSIVGDYEGVIVERWADYSESAQGSHPYFRLQIEADGGKRTTVKVDPTVYESARIGMRIRSRSGQVVLTEPRQPVGK
ncbi:MAG TPA: hypothetical protein VLL54_15330 [Pyrinomonadaceae bacterium]|nr:hypothetical protein [Pyrinomonadaceae bacterium]